MDDLPLVNGDASCGLAGGGEVPPLTGVHGWLFLLQTHHPVTTTSRGVAVLWREGAGRCQSADEGPPAGN